MSMVICDTIDSVRDRSMCSSTKGGPGSRLGARASQLAVITDNDRGLAGADNAEERVWNSIDESRWWRLSVLDGLREVLSFPSFMHLIFPLVSSTLMAGALDEKRVSDICHHERVGP